MAHDRQSLIQSLIALATESLDTGEPMIASVLYGVAGALAYDAEASLAQVVQAHSLELLRKAAEQN